MKSLIMLYVFGIVSISFAQTSQLRYEGQIEGGSLSGTLTSQQFEVSLRRPDNCGGNLGLTQWTANTITIKDGIFTLAPQFDSSKLAKAMDPNNDFAATCSTPYEARELVIRWHDGTNWETFYVPLSDAPRATYALNAGAIGNVKVNPTMTCGTGQYLRFDSVENKFTCSPILAADIPSLSASVISSGTLSPAVIPTFAGDVTGSISSAVVEKIRGVNISSTTPAPGQVLKFSGTDWVPSTDDTGSASDASYSAKGIVQINTDQATSGLYINNGVLALPNVIIGAGPIGDAQTIPVITYDEKGRLTAVGTAPVDDNTKLPLAGGTMQGPIDMGTNSITNATNMASTNVSTRNVVLNDDDNSNTITLRAPTNVSSNYTLTLPPAKGVSGQVLALDGLGNFEWFTPGAGGGSVTQVTSTNSYLTVVNTTTTPQITANLGTTANTLAAGDDARIVGALQKTEYYEDLADVDTCTSVQKPSWNTVSDKWECVAIGTVPESVDFTGNLAGDVTGTQGATVVEKIRGTNVVSTAPTNGQVLKFDGTNWVPSADSGLTSETDPNVQAWAKQAPAARFITTGDTLDLAPRVPFASADPAVGQDGQTLRWNNATSTWEWFTAGVAGSGLQSLGGQTGNTQTFASSVDNTKTAPEISSASDVHTFRYPMASTNGVTAGLISKAEYDSFVAKLTSPLTTKGDMLSHDGTDHVRLPVGTDGQVLAADSSEASGLKWITPTTGTVTEVTSANAYLSVANTTTTPEITANVGTTANTVAAGDDARIVGALQTADYATDLEDVDTCTNTQTVYWNTVADKWTCQNIDFSASGAFIDGGNSFGADATLGTNDPYPLFFETDGSPRMTITNDGRVGIGTTNPIFDGLEIRKNNVPNMGIAIVNDDSNSQARYPAMLIQNHIGAALAGGYPIITLANSRGSASSPASINNGDTLGRFEAHGRGNSGSSLAASIEFKANQPFNSGGYGTDIIFSTVPLNTLTEKSILRLTGQYAGGTALGLVKIEPDSALILGPNFGTNDSWYQLEPGAMWFNSTENVVKYSDGSNARSIASQNASNTFTALNTFQSEVEFQNGLRVGSLGSKMESFATCSDAELITSLSAHAQTTITLMNCPDFQIGMIPQCVFDKLSETNASNLMIQELVTNTPGEVRLKIINFSPNSFSAKTIAFECTGIKASL